jgi:aminoglycoside phosphotransferase (APT) family kinase protein
MHADELDVDVPLVRRLLAAQFPARADLPLEPVVPTGTDNAIYRLGVDMTVRLPRLPQSAGRLEKERNWLPRLAPFLPLAVPAPLAVGNPDDRYPLEWSVYSWLEGNAATVDRISDPGVAATDLASFIAALQLIDATGGPAPGTHNAWRGAPLARRDSAVRSSIAALHDELDVDAVTDAWSAALEAPAWHSQPVWIHGDLDSRNLLVREGRLCAVLDFGCLGVGDPACDVMVAWKLFSGVARDAFRAALAVDEPTWARARGWVLSQALIALSYYTLETNAVLVLEARNWLNEVLA